MLRLICGEGGSVEAECWVEDLEREVEVLPRKSDPTCNSLHLTFPAAMRGAEGGAAPRKPSKKLSGVVLRVQLDGAAVAEQECVRAIQREHERYAQRRVTVHRRLTQLLSLRAAVFSPEDQENRAIISSMWQHIKGKTSSPPPLTPDEAAEDRKLWGSGSQIPGEDWADLGFQRGDSPHSDLRGSGLLGLHLLEYYARTESAMAVSLVEAYRERKLGYPFAAAGINLTQLLVSLLLPPHPKTKSPTKVVSPLKHLLAASHGSAHSSSGESMNGSVAQPDSDLRTTDGRVARLVVVLTRLTGKDAEHPLEETFCCTFGLLEQLWVMHDADYMGFNRVLAALKECVTLWVDDEWRHPTASLEALRAFKVARAQLPPDPLKVWATSPGAHD